jgi:hypothetical protein
MTPIAIFTYNRPHHTKKTIEALKQNLGAEETELYVFCDGWKNEIDKPLVEITRDYCLNINGFKQVVINCSKRNLGLAKNIITGVSSLLEIHESVIVLEDDLITSKGFIAYMNSALNYYKSKNVFSICAYTPKHITYSGYPYSTYIIPRTGSWGWATWKDRWQKTDWAVSDFHDFINSPQKIQNFNCAGNDLTPMLSKQMVGKINSWAIRFTYAGFKHAMPSVYPTKSLVSNVGTDGSGTHMRRSNKYNSEITDAINHHQFCHIMEPDDRVLNNFRRFYNTSIYRRYINYWFIKKVKQLYK